MKKKKDRDLRASWLKVNEDRENRGLPRINRREFLRSAAMTAAGISLPFISGCGSNGGTVTGNEGMNFAGAGVSGAGGSKLVGNSGPVKVDAGSRGLAGSQIAAGGTSTASAGSSATSAGKGGGNAGSSRAGAGGSSGKNGASGGGGSSAGASGNAAGSGGINPNAKVQLGISRNTEVTSSVRDAIEMAGGLSAIKGGDTVVIKTNLTGANPLGETTGGVRWCTSPEVVRAVVQAVAQRTDKKNITVAECTAMGAPTAPVALQVGITAMCQQEGVTFLAWDEHEYVVFEKHPLWEYITQNKLIPKSLTDGSFEHFINVPILKNHQGWGTGINFTACMKHFVGIMPYNPPLGSPAGAFGRNTTAGGQLHTDPHSGEMVAELGMFVPKITMNVVDSLQGGLVGGPTNTMVANAGLILASSDRVACDCLGVSVLQYYADKLNITGVDFANVSVMEQPQIKHGTKIGLGLSDFSKVEVHDQGVSEINDILAYWKK